MFSLEAFYNIIHENLVDPIDHSSIYFYKFGSTDVKDIKAVNPYSEKFHQLIHRDDILQRVLFNDQEPIDSVNFSKIYSEHYPIHMKHKSEKSSFADSGFTNYFEDGCNFHVVANSEHSQEKDALFKKFGVLNWYYFFHGFAALDWYRNFQYLPPIRNYLKVFITFNNLFTEKRSYRLNLISRIADLDGYISLGQHNTANQIKQEIFSPNSLLSKESQKLILTNLLNTNLSKYIIDTEDHHGALSASGDYKDYLALSYGLFHLVTETVFYDEKLHLTEKVFKPIVARRPFFLVAAPGNLAYLKSYGFKTFDRWIDESYDEEKDPDLRIIKITNEVRRLCNMPYEELDKMYQEMQEVLDYNFNWFYRDFKQVLVNELVDNFVNCLVQYNTQVPQQPIKFDHVDFESVKKLLSR